MLVSSVRRLGGKKNTAGKGFPLEQLFKRLIAWKNWDFSLIGRNGQAKHRKR